MEDEPSTISEKLFEEFKAGNPLFFAMALFVVLLLCSLWVWQTVNAPLGTPTPKFSHPTAAARIKTLTAQAPKIAPASATPAALMLESTPVPIAAFFRTEKINPRD